MSYIRVNIFDREGAISGDMHGSMTEVLVATLTAEPETIAEFEKAIKRYVEMESDWGPFRGFRKHEDLEPYDAGIVAIDLRARLIGYETTYSIPSKEGMVRVPNKFADDENEDIYIPFHLPDDWTIVESMPVFEGSRRHNEELRLAHYPFDARPILYGRPLLTFIVESIFSESDLERADLFTDIHACWLMTSRTDLRGKTPREVLFEKRKFISRDMDSRFQQWSFTKASPPPLCKSSFAYENAGFGTHEWVIYYDLVRHLLASCVARAKNERFEIDEEIQRLRGVRDAWLRESDSEFRGRPPLWIIEQERLRINLTVSAQEALIDEECPCCVELSQMFDTPMFWFLDGCNMDEGFEFSHHGTREEWEEEQREWEKMDRLHAERKRNDPEYSNYKRHEDDEDPF